MASHFHDVLETVENPQFINGGNRGTLKATVIWQKQDGWMKRPSRLTASTTPSGMPWISPEMNTFPNGPITITRPIS